MTGCKSIIYCTHEKNAEICQEIADRLGLKVCETMIDQNLRDAYFLVAQAKAQAIRTAGQTAIIIISSLTELPMTKIAEKIETFISWNIILVIADIPITWEISWKKNAKALETICSVIDSYTGVPRFKKSRGRPNAKYPENWSILYQQWKNRELTAKAFMEKTGLKRTTFYKLLDEWETSISSA